MRTIQRYFAFVVAELRLRFDAAGTVDCDSRLGRQCEIRPRERDRSSLCHVSVRERQSFPLASTPHARTHGAEPADPHGRPCRGPIGSGLRLLVLAADWLVGYWTRLVHLRAKGYILAFDRTYFDPVVDPKRYRHRAGPRLARALWWLLPKPDLVFLLDSEPDVLWHRKQEFRVQSSRARGTRTEHRYASYQPVMCWMGVCR